MTKQSKRALRVSDQLRRLIEDSGLSKYRLARLTQIDESTLSRFMTGERGLSMKALDRLGDVLGLKVTAETRLPISDTETR